MWRIRYAARMSTSNVTPTILGMAIYAGVGSATTANGPSLIGTGTYGFHPFQRGDDVGSFPSGHA